MFVQEDVLNQIQLELARDLKLRDGLVNIIRSIAFSKNYRSWEDSEQFEGSQFHLPDSMVSKNDFEARLLNRLELEHDDLLQVKITIFGNKVFLTDGLWVPSQFRVFPFADESDLLSKAIQDLGWQKWATTIIDPACGCGHNMLKYQGRACRVGLDINTRAMSFAAINRLLNRVSNQTPGGCLIGLNNITEGIPLVLRGNSGDRVLFIVNMPFAIQPESDVLPISADGGPHGYEMTMAALEAIRGYEELSKGASVRAVVLVYTLGNSEEERWFVHEKAKKLFGDNRVSWKLLRDEKLWRINGKKEQENPMPITKLHLKADCKFYVRDPKRRDEVRKRYLECEAKLQKEGFDHLAYGILSID
ncbi:MAG: hypothetical protein ABR909_09705 [Candidatus Bathyarchaeia archaeon]|jgi:hypothetical protein